MGQVIDYAIVRNCRATAQVCGRRGSDHELVAIIVTVRTPRGDRVYRLALWNVRRDRPGHEIREHLIDLIEGSDDAAPFDVLLLVETDGYKATLRSLEEFGHTVAVYSAEPGQANTAIVVRAGLDTSRHHCRRMTRRGWFTVRGGRTPAKWLPSVLVDELLRVAVGHPAPSVDSKPVRRGRIGRLVHRLIGPARRVASTRSWMRSAREWWDARAPHRAVVFTADFNEPPTSRGKHTPHWLAEQAGARIVAPDQPTHGPRGR